MEQMYHYGLLSQDVCLVLLYFQINELEFIIRQFVK